MKLFGRKKKKAQTETRTIPVKLKARYDAAQTTRENARHWAMADGLSADAAASPDVRKKLRERARYEIANNSYAKGIILTLANDAIGTGPRLQVQTDDRQLNRRVEESFNAWAANVNLASKLRSMRMAKCGDGETFAVLTNNPKMAGAVKLDVKLVEADRVAAPWPQISSYVDASKDVDGIRFDSFGNPAGYFVLKDHPGEISGINEYDFLPADSVIHWFRADRPGQHRGVPEITPALGLFAQLRRYTLAVIAAAESAADFAAVLYTDAPANGEAASVEAMDIVELEKRMATVLPDGWKLGQIKAEQPCTGYSEFKREILNEIARCLNLPYNIAACNSSGYNYASGRLDHQTYYKSIRVEQGDISTVVLDRLFEAWVDEAMLTSEFSVLRHLGSIAHQWFFDGTEHVDPAKEANAQKTRLESNTTTLAAEYARSGRDWEAELTQRAKEKKFMREIGLTEDESLPAKEQTSEKQPA